MPISDVRCCDCMDFMKEFPDGFFDLAVVDPPYGIGEGNKKNKTRSSYTGFGGNKKWVKANDYGGGEFDNDIPDGFYYEMLFRKSKNQIIWGANYMVQHLQPSMGWIVWDKDNGGSDQSDCELAYSSFERGLRKFTYRWQGLLQQNMKNKEKRIHPTQKPATLYYWILQNYANLGDKIIDTHLGSGSSRIAAYKLGFDFYGCEIDKDYFDAQEKRFKEAINEPLFQTQPNKSEQTNLFP